MSTTIAAPDVESWYRTYAAQLRFAAGRIAGAADAEDAIQEAFVSVWRARERYDGSDPYPWLHRIATRKALNIVAARRPVEGFRADVPGAPSAEDEALAHARRAAIRTALGDEPVVALHLIGGLRFHEIGERFGVPLATAASRIRRGKRRVALRLRATLTELAESQPA